MASLLLTTTVAALASFVGLKASAQDASMARGPALAQPANPTTVIQPRFVSPTAVGLLRIVDQALSNNGLAERIYRDPDAVAAEFQLSSNERLVLRQMTREQFQVARMDAARLVTGRTVNARTTRLPAGATDARLITERMIVGRAILAAVGRSYLEAADAQACCPWSKAIELGINSDPAFYNQIFEQPSAAGAPR
jgi:hypothetical protein